MAKTFKFTLRISESDRDIIHERAARSGQKSVAEYVRFCALRESAAGAGDGLDVAEALGRYGNLLSRIVMLQGKETDRPGELDFLLKDFAELSLLIRQNLGRAG